MSESPGEGIPQKKEPEIIDAAMSSKIGPDGEVINIAYPVNTDGSPMVPFENRQVVGHDAKGKPIFAPLEPGELLNRVSTEPQEDIQAGYTEKGPNPIPPGQNLDQKA